MLLENAGQGLVSRRTFYFPPMRGFMINPDVRRYAFSPDGNWLFILYDMYSDYYEKSLRLQTYLLDIDLGILYDYGRIDGPFGSLNPQLVWSPDGSRVLFFLTNLDAEGQYTLDVYQTNLQTGERLTPYSQGILTGSDYFYITNIYWR
jgi:Tol biopolymer transport system component